MTRAVLIGTLAVMLIAFSAWLIANSPLRGDPMVYAVRVR